MIRNLQLSNFKCFQKVELPLAPLTLLAGTNASGKSSVMQALLLLRQSHYHGALERGELLLSSNLTNVGTAGDVIYEQAANDDIHFALQDDQGRQSNFSFLYRTAEKEDYVLRAATQESVDYVKDLNLFAPQFNYLNAEREGPRLLYPMAELRGDSTYVGVKGQYAAHVLVRHGEEPIGCAALAYQDKETRELSLKLDAQTRYWMRTIVPKFDMQLEALTSADQVRVMLQTETRKPVRPTNIGFGIIYTLPVVVATLVAKQGSLVMIENPEAHLHPLGQSRIGYFLAQAAAAGIQIIIETHSDHVLNGIRRAVRQKAIPAENVALHFFESAGKLVTPQIFQDGGITPWPDGFFDQAEKDLMELF